MNTAKACRFATYPGDMREAVGQVVGPNTTNEYLQCVSAEYDEAADKTRLGFSYNLRRNDDGSLSMRLPIGGVS